MFYLIALVVIIVLVIGLYLFVKYYNYKLMKRGTTYDDNMGDVVDEFNEHYIKRMKKIENINKTNKDHHYKNYNDYDDGDSEFHDNFFNFRNTNYHIDRKNAQDQVDVNKYIGMDIKDIYDEMVKN